MHKSDRGIQNIINYTIKNLFINVTHLLKTSCKSHFWLFEYDAPFKEKEILFTMTQKLSFYSILTEITNKKLLAYVELVCDKNASKVWFIYS